MRPIPESRHETRTPVLERQNGGELPQASKRPSACKNVLIDTAAMAARG
jgi:hypothetical protein